MSRLATAEAGSTGATTIRAALVGALLPALFAIWLYWPTWNGGLLSDDLVLMGYHVQPGPEAPRVDWQRVWNDFSGPWAFGERTFYRPLVSLTWAIECWLGDGAEWVFHVTNIGLFALSVLSFGVLFGILTGRAGALAGGLLLAAHPAAHEPICWPCTRADYMVLIAGAWACVAFVRYMQGRWHIGWTVVAAVAALLSKEVGVLLAVWFLLLDVAVRGPTGSYAKRLALHLRLSPLWLAYLGWRWLILGTMIAYPAPAAQDGTWRTWLVLQGEKLQACALPMGSRVPPTTALALGLLLGAVVLGGWAWPRHRRLLAIGGAWMLVGFLPAQWIGVSPNFWNGRVVLAALPGLCLAVAAVLGSDAAPRWFRTGGAALLAVAVVHLAAGSRAIQSAYAEAWTQMRALREQIDDAGSRATVEHPLVLIGAVHGDADIPFLPPTMSFSIAEIPVASRDHPFVSLGTSLLPENGPLYLARETGPMRMLWQHGATLCYWSEPHTQGQLVLLPKPQELAEIELRAVADGGFAVEGGSASPWPIAGVQVLAGAPFAGGELTWSSRSGSSGRLPIGPAQRTAEGWSAVVDLGEDFDFLISGSLAGGIVGFRVHLTSPAALVRPLTLHVLAAPEPAPLAHPLRGANASLSELTGGLSRSNLPPAAEPGSASVVLMNATCAFRLELRDGQPFVLPPGVAGLLGELYRFVHVDRFYYYLECRLDGRVWRSAVDWFLYEGERER